MQELGEPEEIRERRKPSDQSLNPSPVKGWLLNVPVNMNRSMDLAELKANYWRHGIPKHVHEWLLTQVGPTGSYLQWAEEDPEVKWVYTGSNMLPWKVARETGKTNMVQLRFRERRMAMLFKLAWWEKL